jgi:hypothetical protein
MFRGKRLRASLKEVVASELRRRERGLPLGLRRSAPPSRASRTTALWQWSWPNRWKTQYQRVIKGVKARE